MSTYDDQVITNKEAMKSGLPPTPRHKTFQAIYDFSKNTAGVVALDVVDLLAIDPAKICLGNTNQVLNFTVSGSSVSVVQALKDASGTAVTATMAFGVTGGTTTLFATALAGTVSRNAPSAALIMTAASTIAAVILTASATIATGIIAVYFSVEDESFMS
jgi:hypothetical protein